MKSVSEIRHQAVVALRTTKCKNLVAHSLKTRHIHSRLESFFGGWRHMYWYTVYIMQAGKALLPCVVYKSRWIARECPYFKVFFYPKGDHDKCHKFSKYMYLWAHKISNINDKLWTYALPKARQMTILSNLVNRKFVKLVHIHKTAQMLSYMPLAWKKMFPVDCGRIHLKGENYLAS